MVGCFLFEQNTHTIHSYSYAGVGTRTILGVGDFWSSGQNSLIMVERALQLSGVSNSAEHEEMAGLTVQFRLG